MSFCGYSPTSYPNYLAVSYYIRVYPSYPIISHDILGGENPRCLSIWINFSIYLKKLDIQAVYTRYCVLFLLEKEISA